MKTMNLLNAIRVVVFFVIGAIVPMSVAANMTCEKSEAFKYLEQRDSLKYRGEVQRDFVGRILNYKVNPETSVQFLYNKDSKTPLAVRVNGGNITSLGSTVTQTGESKLDLDNDVLAAAENNTQEKMKDSHAANEQTDSENPIARQCKTTPSISSLEKSIFTDSIGDGCLSDCDINLAIDIAICTLNAPGAGGCVTRAIGIHQRCSRGCGF
jgi:hypothetical protein